MICRSDSQLLSGIGERAVSPGGRGHAPPLRPEDEIARGARAPQRPMLPGGDGLGPHPALSHGEREKDERQPARRAGPHQTSGQGQALPLPPEDESTAARALHRDLCCPGATGWALTLPSPTGRGRKTKDSRRGAPAPHQTSGQGQALPLLRENKSTRGATGWALTPPSPGGRGSSRRGALRAPWDSSAPRRRRGTSE